MGAHQLVAGLSLDAFSPTTVGRVARGENVAWNNSAKAEACGSSSRSGLATVKISKNIYLEESLPNVPAGSEVKITKLEAKPLWRQTAEKR